MGKGKRTQAGFTLIEAMIVAAIVGILAAVLMPEVRMYTARTKVSEAITILGTCRNVISEIYLSGSDIPGIDNWGCEAERPTRFVERVRTTADGVVRVTLGNEVGDLRLAFFEITFAPLNGAGNPMSENDLGTPIRRWRCGSPADGTDLRHQYLPASCRG
jgi:type IV pilus assembly protein PilA